MTTSMAMPSGSGAYSAGAMIPITRTFVQNGNGGQITTQYTLIGQVLDNGQTNWVGYNRGSADYLITSTAPNAPQTVLADGTTYYISDGKAPAGYLAGVTTTAMSSGPSGTADSGSSDMAAASPTTSGSDTMSQSSSTSSSSGSAAAATTSAPSAGNRLTTGSISGLAIGLLVIFSL